MKITNKVVYQNLDKLFEEARTVELKKSDKYVVFSDLHMGDGGSNDDFKDNSELFITALDQYYLAGSYGLILNGDVEELQRFKLRKIMERWKVIYDLFDAFHRHTSLIKTVGNHDLELSIMKDLPFAYPVYDAVKLKHKKQHLFFFHGHQASKKYQKHNVLIGLTLKYFANPLGIKNYSVAHSSKKQYNIEKRAYHYSAYRKIVSVIGHTHRPLFESLHKVERLKYKIEQLCREYVANDAANPEEIKDTIKSNKQDLLRYYKEAKDTNYQNYVYNTIFHIPCLFNSGCVIGKRGMTCLEIENGMIRLVHWFDANIDQKYLQQSGYQPERIGDSEYYRMVINEESLDYIFTRIKFLA